jgi:hypothetical protein
LPEHPVRYAALTERGDHSHDKEGEPADDEGPRDDGQSLGRLLLSLRLQGDVLFLLLLFSDPGDCQLRAAGHWLVRSVVYRHFIAHCTEYCFHHRPPAVLCSALLCTPPEQWQCGSVLSGGEGGRVIRLAAHAGVLGAELHCAAPAQ